MFVITINGYPKYYMRKEIDAINYCNLFSDSFNTLNYYKVTEKKLPKKKEVEIFGRSWDAIQDMQRPDRREREKDI